MQSSKAHWLLLLFCGCVCSFSNWQQQMEQEQTDKLAYCRALQQLQQEYELENCEQLLQQEATTGELLMDSLQRCWWGWELLGRRCRKRA
ncbi:uncharacterized protein LOC108604504 [Drosophila busckii]|uniref:uncharacterized protein LOC108604504 n=1 Tax=Drosophila busckii TaxID=30019 RepID=UPI00083EB7B3|nr:uncharacterized protein LOC108604504 [Drosophila busckii]